MRRRSQIIPRASPEQLSLLNSLLRYEPEKRLTAIEALSHTFYDELRRGTGAGPAGPWQLRLPGGKQARVDLFDFTDLGASRPPFPCWSPLRPPSSRSKTVAWRCNQPRRRV
jgi:serine/threonine protein kinase